MNVKINEVTLNVDFMDVDFMEVFEPALYEMQNGISASKNIKGSVAAGYKALNQTVETFFDTVFGEGTSDRIFQNGRNVMVHLQAVAEINEAYKKEQKQFNDFSNRYMQRQNNFQSMQGYKTKQKHQNN